MDGKKRGGKTTKTHAIVDGLGNPIYFQLSAGNVNDSTEAVSVLSHVNIADSTALADKAHGTKEIFDYLQIQDADYAIPHKINTRIPWRCDRWLYKERRLVERFFLKLKNFRRAVTYDKFGLFVSSLCIYCRYLYFVEIAQSTRLFGNDLMSSL